MTSAVTKPGTFPARSRMSDRLPDQAERPDGESNEQEGGRFHPAQVVPRARMAESRLLDAGDRLAGAEAREDREHRGEVRIGPAHPAIYPPQPPLLYIPDTHRAPCGLNGFSWS